MWTESPDNRIKPPKPQILEEKKRSLCFKGIHWELLVSSKWGLSPLVHFTRGSLTNWPGRETSEHQPRERKVRVGHGVPVKTESKAAGTESGLMAAGGWGWVMGSDCLSGAGFPFRVMTMSRN